MVVIKGHLTLLGAIDSREQGRLLSLGKVGDDRGRRFTGRMWSEAFGTAKEVCCSSVDMIGSGLRGYSYGSSREVI